LSSTFNKQFDNYQFGVVGSELQRFIYDDFASNYIELSKVTLHSEDATVVESAKSTLAFVMVEITKMLHPFMPFVTDEIYSAITGNSITDATYNDLKTYDNISDVDNIIDIIDAIRVFRAENNVANKVPIKYSADIPADLSKYSERLANAKISDDMSSDTSVISTKKLSITIDMEGLIDKELVHKQLELEKDKLEKEIKRAEGMLSNENFISKAPAEKIAQETEKLNNYRSQLEEVNKKLS
jgi:valyl-tRNA synthetase